MSSHVQNDGGGGGGCLYFVSIYALLVSVMILPLVW